MGTFVTSGSLPELYDEKVPLLPLPEDVTYDNVPRARDLNRLKEALFDIRSHFRETQLLDARTYQPTADGVTDDTAAIQALFTAADSANARVYIPAGTYAISATIVCKGTVSTALRISGGQGMSRGLGGGVIFKWIGAAGGKLFKFRGLNNCLIENITFHGNSLADCAVHSCEYVEAAGANLRPSQNVFWHNCQFVGVRPNASSDAFRVGLDDATQTDLQTSEYVWDQCYFASGGAGAARAGIHIQTPGNCKNFKANDCVFNSLDYGWYQPSGDGTTDVHSCFFTNIGFNASGWAVYMGSGKALNVTSLRMENGGTGYRAGILFSANACCVDWRGGYFAGFAPTDDYVVSVDGPATVTGVSFQWNERVGSNVCKLKVATPTTRGSLTVIGNSFSWNTTAISHVPLYDGGDNHLFESDFYRYTRGGATAINNKAGLLGADHTTMLQNVTAMPIRNALGSPWVSEVVAGATVVEDDERFVVTCPFGLFSAAALTKTITIGRFPTMENVRNVTTKVTANFAGIAGPVTAEVGIDTDPNAFILSHTVSAGTPTKGLANADLGVELASGTRAHPNGYMVPSGSNPYLQITLTSASGNLSGLSAGSITVTCEYKYQGSGGA